ncbi:MAG: hypothetical protein ACRDFX_07420 [Chloroflexota bacterium]
MRLRRLLLTPVLLAVAMVAYPMSAAFAYGHNVRDDSDSSAYFVTFAESREGWTHVIGPGNGFDFNTMVDCEQLDVSCEMGTFDGAQWYPYPNPSGYWMCPYAHIARQANWSGNYAVYGASGGPSESLPQWEYLDQWPPVPKQYFYQTGWEEIVNEGPSGTGVQGAGAINADAVDFHYNPNNRNDPNCT